MAGEAKYVSDITEADLLHAAPVASTRTLAVVSKLDASAAMAAFPGEVVAFITAKDIPGSNDISSESCVPQPNSSLIPISEQLLIPEGGTTTHVDANMLLIRVRLHVRERRKL